MTVPFEQVVRVREMHDLASFLEGLRAAARGLLRVRIGEDTGYSTSGWLLTDSLVVVPDYAVPDYAVPDGASGILFACSSSADGPVEIEADLVHLPDPPPDGSRPALLRLRRPLAGCAIRLDLDISPAGRRVVLLHHPRGEQAARLSLGRVLGVTGPWLRHDAETEAGSGGGPLLVAGTMGVLAMHVRHSPDQDSVSEALSLAVMLDQLRESAAWDEIARHHGLADVRAARRALESYASTPAGLPADGALIAAALQWTVDPGRLRPEDRDRLRPLVARPEASRWSLPAAERQQAIRSAGSLDALRGYHHAEPSDEAGQRVIDRILQGPPYDLDTQDDEELPYWLQAVSWFAEVVSGLPAPAQVYRTLERRRVRGRLRAIAGLGFRGRRAELAALRQWYADQAAGPMVVSGIGGVGKSALVARFAEELPSETLLLWLDFDRADLAPDDAVSLLDSLVAQATVQLDGFTAPVVAESAWPVSVAEFGAEITRTMPDRSLLVLDGFEIAQHVRHYQEIWPVLDQLLVAAPTMRVLVSGRAPVTGLELAGRAARNVHLSGLDREDAAAWLRERGVGNPAVLERVLELSRGVPLVLKLALRLLDAGGDVEDLPQTMVEGYLYQRILERVVDPALQPVASDALVLRAVHAEMLAAVLPDRIPDGLQPAELLERLARELAIVEDLDAAAGAGPAATLRLRPEVRSATLRLLELADADRVREIDRRAVAWYRRQDPDDVANVAEFVYHLLRLGDVAGATAAWREGCAARLVTAEEDIPDPAARAWLRERLGEAESRAGGLEAWEQDAAALIRKAHARGLDRQVPQILFERTERTGASSLVVFDAWIRWQAGDLPAARDLLARAGLPEGPVGRDRAVLGAALAVEANDLAEADRLLALVDADEHWADRPEGELEALAVQAARVRLTVDLAAELELSGIVRGTEMLGGKLVRSLQVLVAPGDVMLPSLSRLLEGISEQEKVGTLAVPTDAEQLTEFRDRLEWERRRQRGGSVSPSDPVKHSARWERALTLGQQLGERGNRRWHIASTSLFLIRAYRAAISTPEPSDPMQLAIALTLAAFRGQRMLVRTASGKVVSELAHLLDQAMPPLNVLPDQLPESRAAFAQAVLRHEDIDLAEIAPWIEYPDVEPLPPRVFVDVLTSVTQLPPGRRLPSGIRSVLRFLVGPDPLEVLTRRVLGLPESRPA